MQFTAALLFVLAGIVSAAPKPGINDCGKPFGRCYSALDVKVLAERAANPSPVSAPPAPPMPTDDGIMTAWKGEDGIMTAFKEDDGIVTAWNDEDGIMTAWKGEDGVMTAWKREDGIMSVFEDGAVMTAWAPQPTQ